MSKNKNKSVKNEMIRRYGYGCFIEKLGLRSTAGIEYKGSGQRRRMKELTYHHIRQRSDDGETSVGNGAILSVENHAWFHKQPKNAQAQMNALFQEFKKRIDSGAIQKCDVVYTAELPSNSVDVKTATFNPNEFNRARVKRETRLMVENYYNSLAGESR